MYDIFVNLVSIELKHQLTIEILTNDNNVLTSLMPADFFQHEISIASVTQPIVFIGV